MEIEEKNLAKLKRLFAFMDEDSLTREEFLKSFEAVLKIVESIKKTNEKEFGLIHENLKLMAEKMRDDNNSSVAEKKKEMMDYCHSEMEKMYKEHEKMMSGTEKVLSKIKIPEIEEIEKELPKLGKEIRDSLELLQGDERVDISAIKGLMEKLEEIKQTRMGGTYFGGAKSRFIDDETLSGNIDGINTIFTITKSPIQGSLKVYVNGQRMRVTTDYTLANKTITFITPPPTNSILLADFRY